MASGRVEDSVAVLVRGMGMRAGCRLLARRSAAWLVAGWLAAGNVSTVPALAQQVPFRNYTVLDGLPTDVVRSVIQDTAGFLWLGTEGGAARFDGTEFATFDRSDGLSSNWINQMVVDHDGGLWFASSEGGVTHLVADRFERFPPDSSGNPAGAISLHCDRHGRVWVGWDRPYVYDGASPEPATFHPIEADSDLLEGPLFAIFVDLEDRLWIGAESGYQVLEPTGPDHRYRVIARGGPFWVSSFAQDAGGTMWMGSTRGLASFGKDSSGVPTPVAVPGSLAHLDGKWIRSLFLDVTGSLWIGTNGWGALRLANDGTSQTFAVDNGLAGNNVLGIAQDREHTMWFATTTGVSKLTTLQFLNYGVRDGLAHNGVMCIVEDAQGDLWIGTNQGVSRISNGRIVDRGNEYGLDRTFTLYAIRDHANRVWMGSELGASRLENGRFHTFGPADGWHLGHRRWNRARSLWEDERGWIWLGSEDGLSVFKDGRFFSYSWPMASDSLGGAVLTDTRGDVWVGFLSGDGILRLSVTDPGRGQAPHLEEVAHYRAPADLADGRICARERDRDGNLWFGTRGAGALKFVLHDDKVERIEQFSTANGLADNYVRSILADSHGALWFGTNRGVNCLPPEIEGRTRFRHMTVEDGLPANMVQFCYEDGHGQLWFGTANGVARYTPNSEPAAVVAPPVRLTGFSVFGEPDSAALARGRATLPHDQHSVAFRFVGLTYKSERPPLYRYMLAPLDREWSGQTPARQINYAHLPPGQYEFRVLAENADGLASAQAASFLLHIQSPLWQRWWAIAAGVGVMMGIIFGLHRFRVRRLLEVERVRSSIAADLHDDLGSGLSSLSILSELILRDAPVGGPRLAHFLERIHGESRAMVETMDDIVWSIRPEGDTLPALVARMGRFATEVLEPSGATFVLEPAGIDSTVRLGMESKRDLYLIFKEAVTNAARHSRCQSVRASLSVADGSIALTVSDDGRGFVADAESGEGDGLHNMRARARAMGGTLRVETRPGSGCTVELVFPTGRLRRPR